MTSRSLPVVTVASPPPAPRTSSPKPLTDEEEGATLALTTELLGCSFRDDNKRSSSVQLAMTAKKNSTISLDITDNSGKVISRIYHV